MIILDGQIESPDIIVDHSKCDLCANCARTCPMGVLKIVERKVVRQPNICIGCRNCQVSCSPRAIEVVGQHRIVTGAPDIGYAGLRNYRPYTGLSPAKRSLVSKRSHVSSFLQKQESRRNWTPASAGVTGGRGSQPNQPDSSMRGGNEGQEI